MAKRTEARVEVVERLNKLLSKFNKDIDSNHDVNWIADRTDMYSCSVRDIFEDRVVPTIIQLDKICRCFGITIKEFFSDEYLEIATDPSDSNNLPYPHKRLLEFYDLLPANQREFVVDMVKLLLKNNQVDS